MKIIILLLISSSLSFLNASTSSSSPTPDQQKVTAEQAQHKGIVEKIHSTKNPDVIIQTHTIHENKTKIGVYIHDDTPEKAEKLATIRKKIPEILSVLAIQKTKPNSVYFFRFDESTIGKEPINFYPFEKSEHTCYDIT